MKKALTLVLILVLGMVGTTLMGAGNATATTTANVQSAAAIAIATNIDFGSILGDAVQPLIDPTSAVTHVDLLGSPTIGDFTITAYIGAVVTATLTAATTTLSDGIQTLKFTPSLAQHESTQGSAVAYTSGNDITLTASTHHIYVGGLLEAAAGGNITGITSGTFTSATGDGDIELTVAYN